MTRLRISIWVAKLESTERNTLEFLKLTCGIIIKSYLVFKQCESQAHVYIYILYNYFRDRYINSLERSFGPQLPIIAPSFSGPFLLIFPFDERIRRLRLVLTLTSAPGLDWGLHLLVRLEPPLDA